MPRRPKTPELETLMYLAIAAVVLKSCISVWKECGAPAYQCARALKSNLFVFRM